MLVFVCMCSEMRAQIHSIQFSLQHRCQKNQHHRCRKNIFSFSSTTKFMRMSPARQYNLLLKLRRIRYRDSNGNVTLSRQERAEARSQRRSIVLELGSITRTPASTTVYLPESASDPSYAVKVKLKTADPQTPALRPRAMDTTLGFGLESVTHAPIIEINGQDRCSKQPQPCTSYNSDAFDVSEKNWQRYEFRDLTIPTHSCESHHSRFPARARFSLYVYCDLEPLPRRYG